MVVISLSNVLVPKDATQDDERLGMANASSSGRSIAIWGKPKPDATPSEPVKLEVHFNYWHMRSQSAKSSNSPSFIDIGIKVVGGIGLESLQIYLPISVTTGNIDDLGNLFSDKLIAAGIFNESLSVTGAPNTPYVELSKNGEKFARVYSLCDTKSKELSSHVSADSRNGGTIISIGAPAISEGSHNLSASEFLYFRLRVGLPAGEANAFSQATSPADVWLLSNYVESELIDFRLNEHRNIPDAIIQEMAVTPLHASFKNAPRICRADFFVAVGEAADVSDCMAVHKKRLLESGLWGQYVRTANGSNSPLAEGMVIHHWKKVSGGDEAIDDFNVFIRLRTRRSGRVIIARYLAALLAVGVLSSLLTTGLLWLLDHYESPRTVACQPSEALSKQLPTSTSTPSSSSDPGTQISSKATGGNQ